MRLRYPVTLDEELIKPLIQMTPSSWATTEEKIQTFLQTKRSEVTVDLDILVGKRKTGTVLS